jgi:hypothetical protein
MYTPQAPAMTKSIVLIVNIIQHHLFIPICLLLGVFLRILWIWLVNPGQVSDFVWFENRAESIASGQGYAVNGIPTAYWPVGYPGFLGLVFRVFWPSVIFAKLINIAFYMATIVLTYILGAELFKVESASRIALCILCHGDVLRFLIPSGSGTVNPRFRAHWILNSRWSFVGLGHTHEAAIYISSAHFSGCIF